MFAMIPYGRKIEVGNFYLLKRTKALSKSDLAKLRAENGVPADLKKQVSRQGLPYIVVSAKSGIWQIEYSYLTSVYHFIDNCKLNENGEIVEEYKNALHNYFCVIFGTSTILGDNLYYREINDAICGFMTRSAVQHQVSDEEDSKILAEEQKKFMEQEKLSKIASDLKDTFEKGAENE